MMVADAIKADPGVIDRLIELDPTFRKLRNPVLRRVMARLVTFRDASRVAGLPIERLMAAVNGEDWQAEAGPDGTAPAGALAAEPVPDWMARFDRDAAEILDVRPILEAGDEPLGTAMKRAARIAEDGFFVIEAPFDPAPLRRVLARKGFVSYGRRIADDHWEIVLLRDTALAAASADADGEERTARQWRDGDETHIDVRGLDPPQPMLAILELIESGAVTGPIIVHHEREPIFLYPELAERGWRHEIVAGDPGEVRLCLTAGMAS